MFTSRIMTLALFVFTTFCVALAGDNDREQMLKAAKAHQEAQKTGICEVHKTKMTTEAVPIHWGEAVPPAPGDPPYLYRMQHFPNYVTMIEGGCVKIPGKKAEAIFICSKCKEEATEWGKRGRK